MGLNLVFGIAFHLMLMHLFCYIQCFEVSFSKKFGFSLKKLFFQNFNWSNLFFDQSKFCFKIYVSLCLVRLIELDFRSIKDRISSFLKQFFDYFKSSFSKSFSTFLLSPTWQGNTSHFLSFSSSIFARFSSLKAGMTILSLLFVLFSWFHAFFHAFRGYFRTFLFWDFWWFKACFLKLIIGFWWDIGIFMFGDD